MMSGPDPDSNSECQKKNKKKQKQKSFTLDDYRRRPTVATKTQSTLRENGAGLKQRTVCYAGFSLQFDFLSIFYSSILLLFLSYFSSQFKKPNLFWKILKLGELCCCCCCCVLSARRMGKTNKKCRRLSRSWVWVNRDQIFGRSRPPSCTSELWSSSKGVERNRPILTAQWWVVDGRRLLIFFSFFFFFFFSRVRFYPLHQPKKNKNKIDQQRRRFF